MKDVGENGYVGEKYVGEDRNYQFFTNIQFSPTCFTNIRSPKNSVNIGGKVNGHD